MTEQKGDEARVLEEAGPEGVALAGRDEEFHRPAEGGVTLAEQEGVGLEGDEAVLVPVEGEERHAGGGEGREPVPGLWRGNSAASASAVRPYAGAALGRPG